MSIQIPGFTVEDGDGKVVAENPGQPTAGRRSYSSKTGEQVDRTPESRGRNTHDYLLRIPNALWKAFAKKCANEGITARQGLEFLVKDWVLGKIEITDLDSRR